MASSSAATRSATPVKEASSNFHLYPSPASKYEEVVASPTLFLSTLEKLHQSMGTKFMIPIIGGKELDLHRLFVEVTSRGGIEKIIRERRWKEVTAVFNFPSTATNASYVLRKYYVSLLHHYEQIYYFRARGWTPAPNDYLRSPASAEAQSTTFQQQRMNANTSDILPRANPESLRGTPVIGVIDGKYESAYLITVNIGSEKLKGVLYQVPNQVTVSQPAFADSNCNVLASGRHRRKRRKKSEIKRRDPDHPKPNRSGYNFFFAEQHARLKPLHPGKDREISRMIGELWNKLEDHEKSVYQEKAFKDKERYRIEMEGYRERQRSSQVINDAVPIRQRSPEPDIESSSGESDSEDDKMVEDADMGASPEEKIGTEAEVFSEEKVGAEVSTEEKTGVEMQTQGGTQSQVGGTGVDSSSIAVGTSTEQEASNLQKPVKEVGRESESLLF
ncbi:High mobility group box domain [Dillenia turbinata]|uniref:High mobility group box domain n=1 Tax=Dillenia turbinata TaxID=194707 RepID=A0AAN8YT51_9MAGN